MKSRVYSVFENRVRGKSCYWRAVQHLFKYPRRFTGTALAGDHASGVEPFDRRRFPYLDVMFRRGSALQLFQPVLLQCLSDDSLTLTWLLFKYLSLLFQSVPLGPEV